MPPAMLGAVSSMGGMLPGTVPGVLPRVVPGLVCGPVRGLLRGGRVVPVIVRRGVALVLPVLLGRVLAVRRVLVTPVLHENLLIRYAPTIYP
ncbi:hypothetical protein AB0L05_42210 [Nonomuraea pusilla]|uniref:hypothetical protein n=1 Tax=Nonomuraea pusilla TaxID=46177 RepID=UPI003327CE63